ncbi:MAG: aminoglycoside phosphotransferase family protein [Thiopseudomonas sp.]|nr:aminoglycoside phosphotransferase family protein [Thiopseudomonas sp.]
MTEAIVEKIAAAYERDQARAGKKASIDELPLSYEALTAEWLTHALCRSVPGAVVDKFELGPVDDGSSNRRKIKITYNSKGQSAGLPAALFCKASHDLVNRWVLSISGAALSEATFYRSVRDLLDIEAPRAYFAEVDEESFNSLIILGDISDSVAEFCDHETVVSRSRAESQMKLLATMHGSVYGSPELQKRIQKFITWPENLQKTLGFGMREGSNQGFLDAESVIPARLYRRYNEIWPLTLVSAALHENVPHTLQHGDVHLKNWYVASNDQMGLSDWQCAGRGIWARDVAYTMASSLQPDDRRAWERDLLKEYLELMHEAGGPKVSFDDGWLAYRQQLITALTWWTVTLSPPGTMPDMQPRDTALEFIRRISIAMDDLDTLDALMSG